MRPDDRDIPSTYKWIFSFEEGAGIFYFSLEGDHPSIELSRIHDALQWAWHVMAWHHSTKGSTEILESRLIQNKIKNSSQDLTIGGLGPDLAHSCALPYSSNMERKVLEFCVLTQNVSTSAKIPSSDFPCSKSPFRKIFNCLWWSNIWFDILNANKNILLVWEGYPLLSVLECEKPGQAKIF